MSAAKIAAIFIILIMYSITSPILLDRILHIILSVEFINISYYLKDISFIEKTGRITYPIYI